MACLEEIQPWICSTAYANLLKGVATSPDLQHLHSGNSWAVTKVVASGTSRKSSFCSFLLAPLGFPCIIEGFICSHITVSCSHLLGPEGGMSISVQIVGQFSRTRVLQRLFCHFYLRDAVGMVA